MGPMHVNVAWPVGTVQWRVKGGCNVIISHELIPTGICATPVMWPWIQRMLASLEYQIWP